MTEQPRFDKLNRSRINEGGSTPMFITFGMFIGLIIATIIMIVLIIYLTFTGSKNNKSLHKNTHQAEAEAEAKERLAQNNRAMSHQTDYLHSENMPDPDEFKQKEEINDPYHQEQTQEETIDDDYSLDILPYPKDDDFK